MEPITLAAVTTAVVTLALDAAKEVATDGARQTWVKVKGWLGWTKEPATEDLATDVATALAANTTAAEQIVAELKAANIGAASQMVSKVSVTVTNKTGSMTAGRDINSVQSGSIQVDDGDFNVGGR